MAAPERKLSEEERLRKELSESRDLRQKELSRRGFLVYSALAVGGVAGVAGGGVGGLLYGRGEVRGQLLLPGELTPELREIFKGKNIFVYEPEDETVASIRAYLDSIAAGFDIPPSPLTIPEGKPGSDTVASSLKWLAIDPGNSHLGKGDESVSALQSLVTTETTNVQTLLGRKDIKDIQVASSLKPIEIIGLELAYRRREGKSLFGQVSQEGGYIIVPGAKVGNDGAALGVSESGFRWTVYDATTQNPTPPTDKLVAARVIVAK